MNEPEPFISHTHSSVTATSMSVSSGIWEADPLIHGLTAQSKSTNAQKRKACAPHLSSCFSVRIIKTFRYRIAELTDHEPMNHLGA